MNRTPVKERKSEMSNSVLYMSMSLDGYIAGPNDKPGNAGGDDFMRLHEWYGFRNTATQREGNRLGHIFHGRNQCDRRGSFGPAHRGASRSLGWKSPWRADFRGEPPHTRPFRRELLVGEIFGRWDRKHN